MFTHLMHRQLRHQFWIVLAASVVFFTNLGATGLWDKDETLYASCAREMLTGGDLVVPTFNGELFPDKPPLMYWLMIGGYKLFGINEFAVRFWSAVLGIATALATYHLGRRLFREEVGLWAGLIVATSIIFTVSARAATVDTALTLATTLAMLAFVIGMKDRFGSADVTSSSGDDSHAVAHRPGSWLAFVVMYAAMGVAVLAKGPIGVLLPTAAVGLFLLLTAGKLSLRSLVRSVWQMRPLTAVVVVAIVAVPWFVLVGLRTDGVWLTRFFGEQNFARAIKPFQGHSGPFLYYIPAILIGFFPWSVFLGPSFVESWRKIRQRHAWRNGYIFVACWLGVFVLFWSLVSTKLPHYVLTAYPALALLTAGFIDGWIADPAHVRRYWGRNAAITLIVVGLGIVIAIPIIAAIFLPGEWSIGLVGLILVAGGVVYWYYLEHDRPARAAVVFTVTSVAFLTAIFGFAAIRVDRHQNAEVLIAKIRRSSPGTTQLAAYKFLKESYVFYAGCRIPCYAEPAGLREFLDGAECPYIITNDEQEEELQRHFPGEFSVLARRPRFLHSGEVVVLTRR